MRNLAICCLLLASALSGFWRTEAAEIRVEPAQLERFRGLNPVGTIEVEKDPYQIESPQSSSQSTVCGVVIEGENYHLKSYNSSALAEAAGAEITHHGTCGTCSTLQDLAVYLGTPDLTTPVRRCAILSFSETLAMSCLERLGFTNACAKTWFYNARNTAKHCKAVCMKAWVLGEPNNLPDGSLNACLACDESVSGPVFKQAAGRTRRNSGIASAIKREQGETIQLNHNY